MRCNRKSVAASAFTALALFAAVLGGCGGGGGGVVSPTAHPSATPTPTPPAWTAPGPFTVKRIANLAPANALPNGGGFTGTLTTQSAFLKYTQLTETLTNVPSGVTPLPSTQTLAYVELITTLAVPSAPLTLTLQIPQASVVPGVSYYLAFWDPQCPSLGWQRAFAGPANVSTASGSPTLTFTGNAPVLNRYEDYWLAVYMLPSSAPPPTAAPNIAPSVTPSPTPLVFTDVQRDMGMQYSCSGTPCATGNIPGTPQPQQTYDVVTNLSFPTHSLRGWTTRATIYPMSGQDGDVLYFMPSLSNDLFLTTDFQWDFWVMADQDVWSDITDTGAGHPLLMAALEFDFNDASPGAPGFDYNMSSQCLMHGWEEGGPVWQIWGAKGAGTGWIDSGFQCDPPHTFPKNEWTHITWTYRLHPESLETEYVSLHVQNSQIDCLYTPNPAINPVQEIKKQSKSTIEVQYQQDVRATPAASPFNEYIDDATLRAGGVAPPVASGTPCPVITPAP